MTQRGPLPSADPVYSEADVADMRLRWEQAEKERRVETQLASLVHSFEAFPALVEEIAKRIVLQMLDDRRREQEVQVDRRITWVGAFSTAVQAITAVAILYIALHGAHLL